jgi:hypothetical protein
VRAKPRTYKHTLLAFPGHKRLGGTRTRPAIFGITIPVCSAVPAEKIPVANIPPRHLDRAVPGLVHGASSLATNRRIQMTLDAAGLRLAAHSATASGEAGKCRRRGVKYCRLRAITLAGLE